MPAEKAQHLNSPSLSDQDNFKNVFLLASVFAIIPGTMSRKTIFIIPGYKHSPTKRAYKNISKILKAQGFEPVTIDIPWEKTISKNVKYFLKEFKKIKTAEKYILGFSLGAMIAFVASTKVKVKGLILCSLSPYFKEDLSNLRDPWISDVMKKDFSKLRCAGLAKKIKARKILMLYGTEEARSLINRVTETYGQLPSRNKHLVKVKETGHNIGNERYLRKISLAAKRLN